MPAEPRVDPRLLDAVEVALTRSSTAALDASHEVLAHYGDTGDAPTQRALNTMIDQAADALRALTDSLAEMSGELRATATAATSTAATSTAATFSPPRTSRPTGAAGSSARPRRGRENRG
jgi:hypothetical protein